MTKIKLIIASALVGSLALVSNAYASNKEEGPMERAGKKVDHAAENTKKEVGKALEKTGKHLEKKGDKLNS